MFEIGEKLIVNKGITKYLGYESVVGEVGTVISSNIMYTRIKLRKMILVCGNYNLEEIKLLNDNFDIFTTVPKTKVIGKQ